MMKRKCPQNENDENFQIRSLFYSRNINSKRKLSRKIQHRYKRKKHIENYTGRICK